MLTDFFVKKRWLYICIGMIFFIVASFLSFAVYLSERVVIPLNKTFYYLVTSTNHIEAGTYEAQLNGGAGYLLNCEDGAYVAVAVYLSEEVGKAVQQEMSNTSLIGVSVGDWQLINPKQHSYVNIYKNAMDCLYHCIEVLSMEIGRLDKGATQQSSRATLQILQKQLAYLSNRYEEVFGAFTQVCRDASERIEHVLADTIFAKDLRNIMCQLCDQYIQLTKI